MARGTHIIKAAGAAGRLTAGFAVSLAFLSAWAQAPALPSATQPPGATPPSATPPSATPPGAPGDPAAPATPGGSNADPSVAAPQTPAAPHPAMAISARMLALRSAQTASDVVIIVPDAKSYVDAIAQWTPARLTPVLIDDGTELSREDIARFVRAYKPKRVLRWHGHSGMPMAMGEGGEAVVPAPDAASFAHVAPEDVYRALGALFGAGDGVTDLAGLMQGWKNAEYQPPGLIVTSSDDPAWVAAMALSVGRGQALAFLPPGLVPNRLNGAYTQDEFNQLAIAIEQSVVSLGVPWDGLGDVLDSITLCANAPARVQIEGKEFFATGDLIGRHDGSRKFARWAWPGKISGTASQAAYRAMCALFLQPSEAWIFDGYRNEGGFAEYDGTPAAVPLRGMNIVTRVDDIPNGTARQWRLRGARASTAGLIFVNTMGNADFFDLNPGRGRPGDVPMLAVPSAVHMIHSWSLERPGARDTLGGRWLERGAFVYVGSVNEPYLAGFVTPSVLTRRMANGMIFGAAVRAENAPPWKVVCMGDPLYALGPSMRRNDEPTTYEDRNATPVASGLRDALTARNWSEAFNTLRLEGRDADAEKLLDGILANAAKDRAKDTAKAFPLDGATVRIVVPMLLRRGATQKLLDVAQQALASRDARDGLMDPVVRDALWLSAYPVLSGGADERLTRLLQEVVREDQLVRDVGLLASAHMRGGDFASALDMLRGWRDRASASVQKAIDDVIAQKPEEWGEQ